MNWFNSLSGQAHWVWIALGVILCAGEMLTPGVFLIWVGLAMIVTGMLVAIIPMSFPVALLVFCALAIVLMLLGRKLYGASGKDGDQPFLNRRSEGLVGRVYTLSDPIKGGEGSIVVNDTRWKVRGPDMPAGTRIRVMGVEDALVLLVEQA